MDEEKMNNGEADDFDYTLEDLEEAVKETRMEDGEMLATPEDYRVMERVRQKKLREKNCGSDDAVDEGSDTGNIEMKCTLEEYLEVVRELDAEDGFQTAKLGKYMYGEYESESPEEIFDYDEDEVYDPDKDDSPVVSPKDIYIDISDNSFDRFNGVPGIENWVTTRDMEFHERVLERLRARKRCC